MDLPHYDTPTVKSDIRYRTYNDNTSQWGTTDNMSVGSPQFLYLAGTGKSYSFVGPELKQTLAT